MDFNEAKDYENDFGVTEVNSESNQCNLVGHLQLGLLSSANYDTTQQLVVQTTGSQQPLGLQTEKSDKAKCRLCVDAELN